MNLNAVSEDILESLVKYKFRVILVSIDGANNNTYSIYRRGGNFDNVIKNIEIINYYKIKYGTEFPKLIWQFIVFGHNERELPLAREMAKKLNMRFLPMFNWYQTYSPVKDREFVAKEVGYASYDECEEKSRTLYIFPCHQLWLAPQISPDGELLGCCSNKHTDSFGNVFKIGLRNCLKSEKFIYSRKMLISKKHHRKDIKCFYCGIYKKIQTREVNLISSFFNILKRFI